MLTQLKGFENMKWIFLVIILTFLPISHSFAEFNILGDKIIFDLYPRDGNQIYAVAYTENGKKLWYQVGNPGYKQSKLERNLLLVYYDKISKNFFVMKQGDSLTILPINRTFELVFHTKTEEAPKLTGYEGNENN